MVAKRKVRIHLTDGTTIDGLLIKDRRWVKLYNAAHVESPERSIPLAGHVEIPREKILYRQEIK